MFIRYRSLFRQRYQSVRAAVIENFMENVIVQLPFASRDLTKCIRPAFANDKAN